MKTSETYTIWKSISFAHPYYGNRPVPIEVIPGKATQHILDKYQLIFRKKGINTWLLLSAGNKPDTNNMDSLCFHIQATSPTFYYVSEKIEADAPIGIEAGRIPKSWLTFTIPVCAESRHYSLTIPVKSYYWEFLLFLPHTQTCNGLFLYEKTNRLQFGKAEKIVWPDHPQVISIQSVDPVELNSNHSYTIRLKEQKQGRERVLCEYIPPPLPHRLSPTGKKNTITTYFYL